LQQPEIDADETLSHVELSKPFAEMELESKKEIKEIKKKEKQSTKSKSKHKSENDG